METISVGAVARLRTAALAAALLVCGSAGIDPAGAKIPEPPFILYGSVTVDGKPATSGRVSLRLAGQEADAVTCALGPNSGPGNGPGYVLRVPMDSVDEQAPGAARENDYAEVFVNGVRAAGVVVGEHGTYRELALAVTTLHGIRFTAGPAAEPGEVDSGGRTRVSATAEDSFGHAVGYQWAALCPGLVSAGSFDDPAAASTSWTAPENASGQDAACALKVTVSDAGGTAGVRSVGVTVHPLPHAVTIMAGPAGTPNPVASGGAVALTVSARDGLGHALSFAWSATCATGGPAGSFSGAGPSVGWTAPVNASDEDLGCTIAVEVSDGQGLGVRRTLAQTVLSASHALRIVAAASGAPNPVIAEGAVSLSVSAEDTRGHGLGYAWTAACSGAAGNGAFDAAAARTPIWTAPPLAAGSHEVCVLQVAVTDGHGLGASSSWVEEVRGGGPVAVPVASPESVACPGAVTLDGSASYHERRGRSIVRHEWDLDYDGVRFDRDAAGASVQIPYGQVGKYTVALRVNDDGTPPARSTATLEVLVDGDGPTAVTGGPYLLEEGATLLLDASGSASPGRACGNRIVSFGWDLDADSGFDDAQGSAPRLRWDEVGTRICGGSCELGRAYPIAVRVTDLLGHEATAGSVVWVSPLEHKVTLVAPNGGEMLGSGSRVPVRWVSEAGVDEVRLLLADGRVPGWRQIMKGVTIAAGAGERMWTVPPVLGETLRDCRLKVVALSGAREVGADSSDGPFALGALDVTYPERGAVLAGGGTPAAIRWMSFGLARTAVRARASYTLDGGSSWHPAGEVALPAEEIRWRVPAPERDRERCRVRVRLLDSGGREVGGDAGEGFFTIRGRVSLTSPERGEEVYAGTRRFVRWVSGRVPGVASTLLRLTLDGGRTWRNIGTVRGNPGSFAWEVPPGERRIGGCRLRVVLRDAQGRTIAASSGEGTFAIKPRP